MLDQTSGHQRDSQPEWFRAGLAIEVGHHPASLKSHQTSPAPCGLMQSASYALEIFDYYFDSKYPDQSEKYLFLSAPLPRRLPRSPANALCDLPLDYHPVPDGYAIANLKIRPLLSVSRR